MAFKKNGFFFHPYFLFSTLKISPPGKGKVHQGSRRSAPGVKEKCVRDQGDMLQLNTIFSAESLLLDPQHTSP